MKIEFMSKGIHLPRGGLRERNKYSCNKLATNLQQTCNKLVLLQVEKRLMMFAELLHIIQVIFNGPAAMFHLAVLLLPFALPWIFLNTSSQYESYSFGNDNIRR